MIADDVNAGATRIAAAIGEPARARMLFQLLDGRARTSTELAMIAEVSPSTASMHLSRLKSERLVLVAVQGKHRYYSLNGPDVASVLEGLSVLAGEPRAKFAPSTPSHLQSARTCYDHIAGTLGVMLHDRFIERGWLSPLIGGRDDDYALSDEGAAALEAIGIDIDATRALRRRFACACFDWSERRPHLGGAMGAAILGLALKKRWVVKERDDRALAVTTTGRRELRGRLGLDA